MAADWRSFSELAGTEVIEDLWGAFFRPTRHERMYALVERLARRYRVVAGTNTLDPHYVVHQRQADAEGSWSAAQWCSIGVHEERSEPRVRCGCSSGTA